MYTQCPHCHTVFRVTAAHLSAAGGRVRCGRCRQVFNARDSLSDDLPGTRPEDTTAADADSASPRAAPWTTEDTWEIAPSDALADDIADPEEPVEAERSAAPPEEEEEEEDLPPALREALDAAEAEAGRPRRPWLTLLALLSIAVLLTALAAQVAWFRTDALAAQVPALRPWLEAFCAQARCSVSAPRDTARIALLDREVRSHPEVPDALLITATVINEAPFAQPYPDLAITLYDLTGAAVAARRFAPAEYLPPGVAPEALMASQRPLAIRLEVRDPGKQAINYEFDFL